MNLEDVEKIMKLFEDHTNLQTFEINLEGLSLKLSKFDNKVKVVEAKNVEMPQMNISNDTEVEDDDTKEYIKSPLVGTFHQAPALDAKPFVTVGQKVKKGQKLCIIEAMKVMNEITAPHDGVIKQILCKDNQMVEFDQKLFVIGD
jgi:acetyl-CoA carboxylase biotin carboxyl carrier protein